MFFILSLKEEKRNLQERLNEHQRLIAQAEQQKRELERTQVRLEKDKKALKTTLDRVSLLSCYSCISFGNICDGFVEKWNMSLPHSFIWILN